jgi:glycosyltransferase involved in cell wall biosynthesis
MNVLLLDQFSDLGGGQLDLLDLLPALAGCGWKALVAAPGNGPLGERVRALGADYTTIECGPFRSWTKSAPDACRFAGQWPRLVRRIRSLAKDTGASLIYANGPRILPAACAAAGRRTPVLFHCHSLLEKRYAAAVVGGALALSRATLVGSCRYVLRPLARYRAGEVVYNGVAAPPPVERLPGVRGFTIGMIGRIAPEKGQREFIEAARTVSRRHPGWRFVICGASLFADAAGVAYEAQVREAAAGLPVEFLGWRDDAGAVLASLDLLVVPSLGREATTRVILEAFAAGVPVLASNAGGIAEVVVEGQTGFLTPPADPVELARRIVALLEGGDAGRRTVAETARRCWQEKYTLEHYRRNMLAILARVGASARM